MSIATQTSIGRRVRFTIDHLLPVVIGGTNDFDNLALACFHCNRRKSNKQIAFDTLTQQNVELFNPRFHEWADHFIWSSDGLTIEPLTAIGRATAELLDLNRERIQAIRAADVVVSRHPPPQDPVQKASR
ncbi:MAG: HNH endonuclease signature motif containing protein [Pyrinomonadaceae bacterium]